MPAVMWPTGRVQEASTWRGLFDALRKEQHRAYSRRAFRRELAHRAWVWNQAVIDSPGLRFTEEDAFALFSQLEAAKMVRIVADGTRRAAAWW